MAMYRLLEEERLRRLRQQLGMAEPTEQNAFADYVPVQRLPSAKPIRAEDLPLTEEAQRLRLLARPQPATGVGPPAEEFRPKPGRSFLEYLTNAEQTRLEQEAQEAAVLGGAAKGLVEPVSPEFLSSPLGALAFAPGAGVPIVGGPSLAMAKAAFGGLKAAAPGAVKSYVTAAARGPAAQAVVPVKQATTLARRRIPAGRPIPRNVEELADQIDQLTAEVETLGELGVRPLRPPEGVATWTKGLTNQELTAIAKHENVSPLKTDWWDSLDSVVIKEAKEGRFKNLGAESLVAKKARLRQMNRELDHLLAAPTEEAAQTVGVAQRGMGIGEKPAQGGLFEGLQGEAQKLPLASPENLAAQQARRQALAAGQAEMPVGEAVAKAPSAAVSARGAAPKAVAPKAAKAPRVPQMAEETRPLYEKVIAQLPEDIRADLDNVVRIRLGESAEGIGSRTVILQGKNVEIELQRGSPTIEGGLLHELIVARLIKRPELIEGPSSIFQVDNTARAIIGRMKAGQPLGAPTTPSSVAADQLMEQRLRAMVERQLGYETARPVAPKAAKAAQVTEAQQRAINDIDAPAGSLRWHNARQAIIEGDVPAPTTPSAAAPPTAAPTRAGPSALTQAAAPGARQPNLQAGPRAEPIGPPRKPPPPKPFAAAPGELPSGRKPGGIGQQKPTVTAEPLLKAEAALTPQGKTLVQRISEGADSIVRGLFAQNAGLRDLPESSIGHPFSLAKVIPASSLKGGTVVTERYAPVLESVADNLKDLATYKMLQRDKDLLSGPKPIRNLPGGLTGMGDVLTAEKQLAQKLGPERFAKVKQASEQLDALNRENVVGRLRQEGIITKETEQALLAEHPHYLPFQREDFVTGIESRLSMPTASVSSTGLKRMTEQGSIRALHDPLAALLAQPVRVEHIIARNKAARALIESLQELEKKTGEQLVSMVGPERLAKEANISGAVKPALASIENSNVVGTISYLKDGVQYQAQIPAYYARIAKSLDAEAATGFVNVMRRVTTPFKASVTAYNPGFPLVNLLRDATSFLFNGGIVPFGPSYMRGFKAVITKNANYIAARDAGTFMSGMIESMDSMSKINRVVGRHNRGAFTIRTPQDLALILPRLTRDVGRGIKAFNITIEQTPRAGQFIAAKRAGATSLEAAVKGRDVTVDFAQFGTVMRTVDAIFPFANPAMQGLYITARTIKTHPIRSAIIGASFMFPTILSRVNNMRFETSDKIPDYLYQNNWVVQFGEFIDENGERMPMYFKIPKGPIAGPATFPAEALFNVARSSEDRSAVELLGEGALGSLKALSPIEPSTGAVAPPFGTAVQMQAGKDFYTGMPIVPRGQEALPSEQQFDERTSKVAIALGQATKVSPRVIDFALQDYFGGAGQALLWLSDLVLGAVGYSPEPYGQALKVKQAPQKTPARFPVVGRVYGTAGSQLQRRGWKQFDAAVEDTNRQFLAMPGMNSLGIKLGAVGDSIDTTPGRAGGSVELTPDQRAEYQQHMARQVIPYLQGIMPNLSGITDAELKRKQVMKGMDKVKDAARASFIPILIRQAQQRAAPSATQPAPSQPSVSDADRLRQLREELGMAEPVGAR